MIRFGCRHKEVIDSGQIWISDSSMGDMTKMIQNEVL